jgi:hypothetical protein
VDVLLPAAPNGLGGQQGRVHRSSSGLVKGLLAVPTWEGLVDQSRREENNSIVAMTGINTSPAFASGTTGTGPPLQLSPGQWPELFTVPAWTVTASSFVGVEFAPKLSGEK